MSKKSIKVKGIDIQIHNTNNQDYISLTNIAKYKNRDRTDDIIRNWLRNKNTLTFLKLWEKINNTNFKLVEFDPFWQEAGSNSFVLSAKKRIIVIINR